jgi:predicted nucleic acid-binding protein
MRATPWAGLCPPFRRKSGRPVTPYAFLARRAVLRLAKLVSLPPVVGHHIPGDPNDDPIVQTALSAKADYLVTADAAILQVGKVRDIEILTPAQFEEKSGPED